MLVATIIFWTLTAIAGFAAALFVQFRFLGGVTLRLTLQKAFETLSPRELKATIAQAVGDRPARGAHEDAVSWLRTNYPANLEQLLQFRTVLALGLGGLAIILVSGRLAGVV